jgi:hypothetical protein
VLEAAFVAALNFMYFATFLVAQHRYSPYSTDWGFGTMYKANALSYPGEGMMRPIMEDDKFRFFVHMIILHDETGVMWHDFTK